MRAVRTVLFAAFLLVLASVSHAADILVPGDYSTIQEAINSANEGDRVLVAAGAYSERIRLKTGIDVVSVSGPAVTFIDGGDGGRVVQASAITATLSGFSVTHGNSPTNGGGIDILNGSNVTVDECIVVSNTAAGQGGGIAIQDSQALITSTIIHTNTATGGGGVYIEGTSLANVTLESCSIHANTVTGPGGGILGDNAAFALNGCQIRSNSAGDVGGGIALDGSAPSIAFCNIFVNTAAGGGGISFHNASSGSVLNTTVFGNTGPIGGAIACTNNSSPDIQRTIMAYSLAGAGMYCAQGSTPVVTCCLVWGNVGGDIICGTDGGQNAVSDPQFCREAPAAERNFTVQSDSPAAPANSACEALIGSSGIGCGVDPVAPATWGAIKDTYRR